MSFIKIPSQGYNFYSLSHLEDKRRLMGCDLYVSSQYITHWLCFGSDYIQMYFTEEFADKSGFSGCWVQRDSVNEKTEEFDALHHALLKCC